MANADISIIIPTYNKKNRIKFLLKSLIYQSQDILFDTVIIDDGSTDGTEEVVDKYKNKLRLKYIQIENSGRSHARNIGVDNSTSKYIVFCDDDMILSPNFIKNHYRYLELNPHTLVHGKIYNLPYLSFFEDPEQGTLLQNKTYFQKNAKYIMQYRLSMDFVINQEKLRFQQRISMQEQYLKKIYERNVQSLSFLLCTGGNFSCTRDDFTSTGYFDEDIDKEWGVEDIEFGYRFMLGKKNIVYSDEAYNYHICHYRESYKEELINSCNLFYKKHNDPLLQKLSDLFLKEISLEEFLNLYVKIKNENTEKNK